MKRGTITDEVSIAHTNTPYQDQEDSQREAQSHISCDEGRGDVVEDFIGAIQVVVPRHRLRKYQCAKKGLMYGLVHSLAQHQSWPPAPRCTWRTLGRAE